MCKPGAVQGEREWYLLQSAIMATFTRLLSWRLTSSRLVIHIITSNWNGQPNAQSKPKRGSPPSLLISSNIIRLSEHQDRVDVLISRAVVHFFLKHGNGTSVMRKTCHQSSHMSEELEREESVRLEKHVFLISDVVQPNVLSLTLMSCQTRVTFFLSWNTKEFLKTVLQPLFIVIAWERLTTSFLIMFCFPLKKKPYMSRITFLLLRNPSYSLFQIPDLMCILNLF